MFDCALTRIQIRIHTLHTFLFLSNLEVSKWSRFISQWNITHTHTCPRIYTRLMSKNTVLWARLAPPSNLLVVGVTLLLISQFEFSVNRTERMRMFSYNHIHTSYAILCARLTLPSNLLAVGVTVPLISSPRIRVRILGKSNWVNVFPQLHEYFKAFEKSLIKKNKTPFFF